VLKLMSPACRHQRRLGSATAAGLYDDIRQCPTAPGIPLGLLA
jgi:hypothetical protein